MNAGSSQRPPLQWVQARCHDRISNREHREDLIYYGFRTASVIDLIASDPARFADPERPVRAVVPQEMISSSLLDTVRRIDSAAESGHAEFRELRSRLLDQHRIALISPDRRLQGLYATGMAFEIVEGSLKLDDPDEETTSLPLQGMPIGFYQGRPWLLDIDRHGHQAPPVQHALSTEAEGERQAQWREILNQEGDAATDQRVLVFPGSGRLPTGSGWLDFELDIPPGGLAPLPATEDPQWQPQFAPPPELLQERPLDAWMRTEGLAPSPPPRA